jgi:hypothetical protein
VQLPFFAAHQRTQPASNEFDVLQGPGRSSIWVFRALISRNAAHREKAAEAVLTAEGGFDMKSFYLRHENRSQKQFNEHDVHIQLI